jgi:hypothetical protein
VPWSSSTGDVSLPMRRVQSYGRCVDGLHEKSDPRSSLGNMTRPELVFESIVPQGIVHHDAYGVPDDRAC